MCLHLIVPLKRSPISFINANSSLIAMAANALMFQQPELSDFQDGPNNVYNMLKAVVFVIIF